MPCRRAFRADITPHSLLLSGVAVMTLCILLQKALRWLMVVRSGRNNYVSGVQCPTAHPPHTVQQLLLDISLQRAVVPQKLHLPEWYQNLGLGKWRWQTWSTGEASLGAWGRMGPGAWTVPSQEACVLLGLGVSATAFTLRRPSLMPESGVYVCTVPSLSDYGVFLDCCSNPNTAYSIVSLLSSVVSSEAGANLTAVSAGGPAA